MTKDVIVCVRGMQYAIDQSQEEPVPVEIVVPGQYYKKNGRHYVIYDESVDDANGLIHSMVKFDDHKMEVQKKGAVQTQMIFVENKKNLSIYQTPFGVMNLGIATTGYRMQEEEDCIEAVVDYAQDVDGIHVADCTISVVIHAKPTVSL